jgi:hypothetical protein
MCRYTASHKVRWTRDTIDLGGQMSITWEPTAASPSVDHLEHAVAWGQEIATRLHDGATLWVWGDPTHHDIARDLVDGLVERGAIGSVRHLPLDAPLSAARTTAVRPKDIVVVYAGADAPRSALLALRRTGATIWAITTPDADWTTYADDALATGEDEVRRTTNRLVLAYARAVRQQYPGAALPPFAAAYPRQVSA